MKACKEFLEDVGLLIVLILEKSIGATVLTAERANGLFYRMSTEQNKAYVWTFMALQWPYRARSRCKESLTGPVTVFLVWSYLVFRFLWPHYYREYNEYHSYHEKKQYRCRYLHDGPIEISAFRRCFEIRFGRWRIKKQYRYAYTVKIQYCLAGQWICEHKTVAEDVALDTAIKRAFRQWFNRAIEKTFQPTLST